MRNKNKNLRKQLKALSIGDLIKVEWTDASIGKSRGSGVGVDVLVCSWGIYLGILGKERQHIILAQNNFRYADGLYDIDYTAIPVTWGIKVTIIAKNYVEPEEAKALLNSFLTGGRRTLPRRLKQERISNHERLA